MNTKARKIILVLGIIAGLAILVIAGLGVGYAISTSQQLQQITQDGTTHVQELNAQGSRLKIHSKVVTDHITMTG